MTKQQIIDAVRALPAEEQAELVEELSSGLVVTLDEELMATVLERQRSDDPGVPADEMFARLRPR